VPTELIVKRDEWETWREEIQSSVRLSKETLTVVHLVRSALEEKREALKLYASDRRWQRSAMLMKAAAYFNGRKETNHSDALLLQHCLWTTNENRAAVADIVATAVCETGFEGEIDLAALDRAKHSFELEIQKELYHSEDLYETIEHDGKAYFEFTLRQVDNYNGPWVKDILIPVDKLKSFDDFYPLSRQGGTIKDVACKFDGQGVCEAKFSVYNRQFTQKLKPKILFGRGDKKTGVNQRLVQALFKQVLDLKHQLEGARDQSQSRAESYRDSMASIFVPATKTELAYSCVMEQIQRLNLRVLDCERLQGLCQ